MESAAVPVHEHHGPPEANQSSRIDAQTLGMYLFIISDSKTTNEARVVPAAKPETATRTASLNRRSVSRTRSCSACSDQ